MNKNSHAVLVVEDEVVCRTKVSEALSRNGFDVEQAINGQEGWDIFEKSLGDASLRLVITDIEMPCMDGLELTRRIKQRVPDIPVLVLTAHNDKETIKSALRAGATDFIEKPVSDMSELVPKLTKLIEQTPDIYGRMRDYETAEAIRKVHQSLLSDQVEKSPIHLLDEANGDLCGNIYWSTVDKDGTVLFLIGDASGHSVESSYASASFMGILSTYNKEKEEIGALLNHLNTDVRMGSFPHIPISAMIGRWYPDTAMLDLANAGTSRIWVYKRSLDETKRVLLSGTPLGCVQAPSLDERVVLLEEGDRVLLANDSFVDEEHEDIEAIEREVEIFWTNLVDFPIEKSMEKLRQHIREQGGKEIRDDILLACFEQPAKKAL